MEPPPHPQQPGINPRDFLREHGEDALARKLYREGGYVIQRQTLYDLCEALHARLPLMAEGEPGSGKTALAEGMGLAFNLTRFFLPCHEELTKEEILFEFDARAQEREIRYRIEYDKADRREAQADQWTRKFLVLGEVYAAYEFAIASGLPPVLTLDEVEKLRAAHEILLYEIFARHYAHVPRLEPVPVIGCRAETDEPPVIFATSNDMRVGDKRGDKDSLSRPFRDRFVVTFCDTPRNEEKPTIILAKVPGMSEELLAGLCKIAYEIEHDARFPAKPTLRNLIHCAKSFVRDGHNQVEYEPFLRRLSYFGKDKKQRKNLADAARDLVNCADRKYAQIEEWVARAYEVRQLMIGRDRGFDDSYGLQQLCPANDLRPVNLTGALQ